MLMVGDLGLSINIPDTIYFSIMDKLFMLIGEVDIDIIPATLPPITQLTMVDCCVYMLLIFGFTKLFMEIKDVILVVMME